MYSSLDSTYTTSTTSASDAGAVAAILGVLGTFWLIGLAIAVFALVINWKIFTKAGKKGWYAIVPFLNTYTLAEICGIKGWIGLVAPLCSMIPVVGGIASLAFFIYSYYCLAKVFGKETGFAVGLIFLTVIFEAILAFSDAKYLGAGASPAKTTFMASDEAKAGAGAAKDAGAEAKKDEWVDGKKA